MTNLTKTESALLIGFIAMVSFLLLYLSRQWDNNTISSWRWIFNNQNISTIILSCLLAVVCSYLLSRTAIFEKKPVLWLFILSFSTCASLWGTPELLLDSGRYFLQAKEVSEYGALHFIRQWGLSIQAWTDMPIVPFIYGMLFAIFGEDRVVIQLFNTLLFSLSTILTFLSAQIIIGQKNSFYAGLLMLAMPYLLIQVPLFLVDCNGMFFLSLATYTFLAALHDRSPGKTLLAASCIMLAMLTKYSIWPMLLLLPFLALSFKSPPLLVRIGRTVMIFLAAGLLVALFLIPKFQVVQGQFEILKNYQHPALMQWQESLISTFLFQIHPFVTLLAAFALFSAIGKGNGRLLLIGFFAMFFFYKIPRSRYIIPLLPLLSIMAAKGLDALRFPESRRFVCWLSVSFSFIIMHQAFLPFFNQTTMSNIQRAGAYINTLDGTVIKVVTLPQPQSKAPTFTAIPQLDLFVDKKIIVPSGWVPAAEHPKSYHSLLFTWEMKKPSYYEVPWQVLPPALPLVVISGTPLTDSVISSLWPNTTFSNTKRFSSSSRIFRYKTFITVMH